MTNNTDHDRLFKELISTFFVEFIELFFPQLIDYLDRESITFWNQSINQRGLSNSRMSNQNRNLAF